MGLIMIFIVKIKPNIAFTILIASYFLKNLNYQHIKEVKTIL